MGKTAEHPRSQALVGAKIRLDQLRGRKRKLAAELQKVDAELEKLQAPRQAERAPTVQELDQWFADLGEGLPPLPPLPADFSRADLYDDHD